MSANSLAARIPKVHLHCHLEGCLRSETFVELAAKHGVPLRYKPGGTGGSSFDSAQDDTDSGQDDTGSARDPYRFETFQEFLYIFAAVSRSLRHPDDYARLAREFVEDALAQGVVYGELFVSPSVWTFFNPDLDVRATMKTIVAELRRAQPRAHFTLLPDLTRNFGAERAMETARMVAGMSDLDVIGISLGGDEARFPAALFADVFAFARATGLHCVAHAGEADEASSVRDAIELLGVERIGHGLRALEDSRTMRMLAERNIALEICPTSNHLTGSALPQYPHPYLDFEREGCVVTIDCDDPTLFGTSIAGEYALVERIAGAGALERYVRNAIRASFASAQAKEALEAQVTTSIAELPAAPRS